MRGDWLCVALALRACLPSEAKAVLPPGTFQEESGRLLGLLAGELDWGACRKSRLSWRALEEGKNSHPSYFSRAVFGQTEVCSLVWLEPS